MHLTCWRDLTPHLAIVSLLALAACPGDPPPDGRDRDGDGYDTVSLDGDDCNDADPNINPGAPEVCGDDVDNNCDGAVDDTGTNAVTYYRDADADGFGTDESVVSCSAPSSRWSTETGDCNDDDDGINPGAAEVFYDEVDQNCDPLDEFDADGDGFDSNVHGGQDCDDSDLNVQPNAAEVCDNGIDDNCDGSAGPCRWQDNPLIDLRSAEIRIDVEAPHQVLLGPLDSTLDATDDVFLGYDSSLFGFDVDDAAGTITFAARAADLSLPDLVGTSAQYGYRFLLQDAPPAAQVVAWNVKEEPTISRSEYDGFRFGGTQPLEQEIEHRVFNRSVLVVPDDGPEAPMYGIPTEHWGGAGSAFRGFSGCFVFDVGPSDARERRYRCSVYFPMVAEGAFANQRVTTRGVDRGIPGVLGELDRNRVMFRQFDGGYITIDLDDDCGPWVDGTGCEQPHRQVALSFPSDILRAAGDLNADGYDELLIREDDGATLTIAYGPIDETEPETSSVSADPLQGTELLLDANTGDFDGDGHTDLAAVWSPPSTTTDFSRLTIVYGPLVPGTTMNASGGVTITADSAADEVHVGELNGDGRHDIVVPSLNGANILYGTGL